MSEDLGLKRPATLEEVAYLTNSGAPFRHMIAEFLDSFYLCRDVNKEHMFLAEPALLQSSNSDYEYWQDAYLAGVAENLLTLEKAKIFPSWINYENRFLIKEFYANSGITRLNELLYTESPPAFRKRLIYTEANPLRRASMNVHLNPTYNSSWRKNEY